MSDIKINSKYICTDSGFKITTDDIYNPGEYVELSHDEDNASIEIGTGSKIIKHVDPIVLNDDGYIDLPADPTYGSAGYGFILVEDGEEYVQFCWDYNSTVTLIKNSTNVDDAQTDGKFCIYNNITSVRIENKLGSSKRITFEYNYTETPLAPTFMAFKTLSGVDNLDPNLTINGTTVTPTFRFKGGDADASGWAAWGYGDDTTLQSVATSPDYNNGSPGLGTNDDSVKFNASDYYENSTAVNQITTGDIVVECVFKFSAEVKYIASTLATNGYVIILNTNKIGLYLNDAGGTVTVYSNTDLTDGTWYHFMAFVNRDESSTTPAYGSQVYINGLASGTGVDCSAISGSLTSTAFALGANTTGSVATTATVAYLAAWESAAWHQAGADGPTEWATIAAERFARLCGYYPNVAYTYTPNTATRTYPAYLDKIEDDYRKLYYVGSEWLRMCHRQDTNGVNVKGYLPETAAQNLITHSEDFASNWTLQDVGDTINDNAAICPDGRTVAGELIADTDVGLHGILIAATLTAATYSFSIYLKADDFNWVRLSSSVAGCTCYFDIANGVVGTASSCTGYIEGPFYNDFYRVCIVFTGTAASHNLIIRLADSDGDTTVQGDGLSTSLYFWGAQCELGDYMTSPVLTSGSALTRVKDELQYVAGDNIGGEDTGQGDIYCDVLFSDQSGVELVRYIVDITDGGSANDRIVLFCDDISEYLAGRTRATGLDAGNTAATYALADGLKHTARFSYQTDNIAATVDGANESSQTTSCDMPDDLDELDIGQSYASNNQFNGLISNFRIYSLGGVR